MGHRYSLGTHVRFSFPRRTAADGSYEVLRQLPLSTDGELQYRIKNAAENYERVAKESELDHA
jgi:hypothetical protein